MTPGQISCIIIVLAVGIAFVIGGTLGFAILLIWDDIKDIL